WLPGASAAHTAAIATAILGAAAIVVLHAACRAWGARPLAATVACALFAGAPVVLAIHTEAEVFALGALVVAAVLLVAARRGPLVATLGRSWWWLPGLGGLVVLVAGCVRPAADDSRWQWATLGASFALAGPILVSRFDVAPEGVGRYVVERFHLLPALLLAIP